jgi:hypothetical protein
VENDRCSIPENSPLPHHFATQEEELPEINDVSFECLATLLRQGVESGFDDVTLLRSDPLLSEFSPFMLDVLEVVDSPAESPKYVAT